MSNPSIGNIGGVIYDAPNDRSKGVLNILVRSHAELRARLVEITRVHTQGRRLSVRLFVAHGVDPDPGHGILWNEDPVMLEAFVPVTGHPEVAGYCYYGACLRRQPGHIFSQEFMLLERVGEKSLSRVRDDVETEVLNGRTTKTDVIQLLQIYSSRYTGYLAPFTNDSIRALIAGSRVQVARNPQGHIVSVCVGELTPFHLQGVHKPVMFVELSDSATDLAHQGQGYYMAAKTALMQTLRADDPHVVVTAEGRANSGRVIRANLGLGMRRAALPTGCLGYQPAHCVISSSNDSEVQQVGAHGNLFVFYAPTNA
jgi:hypothetical protein